MWRIVVALVLGLAGTEGKTPARIKRESHQTLCVRAASQLVNRISPVADQPWVKSAAKQLLKFSSLPQLTACDASICALALNLANMKVLLHTRGFSLASDKHTRTVLLNALNALYNLETGITTACPVTPLAVHQIVRLNKFRPTLSTIRSVAAEVIATDRRQRRMIAALLPGAESRRDIMARIGELPQCQLDLLHASSVAARVPHSDTLIETLLRFVDSTSDCSEDDEEKIENLVPHLGNVNSRNMKLVLTAARRFTPDGDPPRIDVDED
jgi:hypothetical protein